MLPSPRGVRCYACIRTVLFLALSLVVAQIARAQTCTTNWTNTSGGAWNEPANWSNGVPDAADDACLTAGGTYTVTGAGITARSIFLGSASGAQTLELNGSLALSDTSRVVDGGIIHWVSGYLEAGALINEGLVSLTGTSGSRGVRGETASMVNRGQMIWDDGGLWYVYLDATFTNESTFRITGTGRIASSTGPGTFVNEAGASFEKTGDASASVAGALTIVNRGSWDVQGGELTVTNPTRHENATLTVADGATLDLRANVTLAGQINATATGALLLQAQLATDPTATLNVGGTGLNWVSGYLESGALINDGLIRLTGTSGSRGIRGETASMVNRGQMIWDDGGLWYVYFDATFTNESTFRITGTGRISSSTGPGTFINEAGASFEKTGDATASVAGSLTIVNRGSWDVQGGELTVTNPTRHENATLTVADGATLDLRSNVTLAGQITATATGALLLQAQLATDPTATLNVGGTGLNWVSGYLESGALINDGLIRLTGTSGSRGIRGETASMVNRGQMIWDDGGLWYVYFDGTFTNESTLRITGTGRISSSTGPGTFINEAGALFEKTGDASASVAGALTIVNRGSWDVQGGELTVTNPTRHENATLDVDAGASLLLSSPVTIVDTLFGAPQGLLQLNARLAVANGATATLRIDEQGLDWKSAYLEEGVLVNEGGIRLTGNSGSRGVRGESARLVNRGLLTWDDAGLFYVYLGGSFNNEATLLITGSGTMNSSTGAGTFVNEVGALLQKTGEETARINGSLTVVNRGRWEVLEGVLNVTNASRHESASLDVSSGAALNMSVGLTVVGPLEGTAEGTTAFGGAMTAAAGARLDFSGTGFAWTSGYLEEGTLVNEGLMHLAGSTGSRGVRGADAVLRNDGHVEWTDGGLFYVYNGGLFENTSTLTVTGAGGLNGFSGVGHFLNGDGATFLRTGEGAFSLGITTTLRGEVALNGTIEPRGYAPDLPGAFGPSLAGTVASDPALTDWRGGLIMHPEGDIRIRLTGSDTTSYDRFSVRDSVGLDGKLLILLEDGYVPTPGSTFEIIAADSIYGGFRDLTELTVEAQNLSLYPSVQEDTLFVLTAAAGIPTVSGALAVQPTRFQAGEAVGLTLTGTGFAPDLSVNLVCAGCFDPAGAASVPARLVSISPGEVQVVVDFTGYDAVGDYEVVVTDPRGGEARSGITVDEPPLEAYVSAPEGVASEADGTPGLFLVRLNRPPREDLTLTYNLGGNATRFSDYSLDIIGGALEVSAGTDSVIVTVFPVGDDVAENDEFVSFSVDGDGLNNPSNTASVRIANGPGIGAFSVFASAPSRAGNAGTTTVTIAGQGFTEDAMVYLAEGGGARLAALGTSVSEDGTRLRSVFRVEGLATGVRDLVVENGDGSSATLIAALELEDASFPEVFVQVNAPPRVPRTRERTYTVTVHNRGNVDVHGTPAIYGLPADAEWTIDPGLFRVEDGRDLSWQELQAFALADSADPTQVIYLPPLVLSAGEVRNIEVRARILTPQTLSLLGSWIYTR